MNGVLDRFEGEQAVILLESVKREVIIPIKELPEGSKEGVWFHLTEVDGTYQVHAIDEAKTEESSASNALLHKKLQKKKKKSKFKRN